MCLDIPGLDRLERKEGQMQGCLYLGVDPSRNENLIKREIEDLQITGVQVSVRSGGSPIIVDLVAETLDQLDEAKRAVERIIGVWLVLIYLGKEALASLLHPGLREKTIGA